MGTLTLLGPTASAAANAVVDLLDVGSANSTGDIAFCTAAGISGLLCVCNLGSPPAFGDATGGVASGVTPSQGVCSAAGTITQAIFRNRDNQEVFRCDVTATGGGGSIVLSGTAVNAEDTIDMNTLNYTQPLS